MTAPVFVDTNVIVYRHDARDPGKQARAGQWYEFLWATRSARVSFQVLQEFYAVITRKVVPTASTSTARSIVRKLMSWQPASIDPAMLERAWLLQDGHSLSWWDALIIAAAQTCGCRVLLTEDLQHGYEFDEVRVVDPFASPDRTPVEVLESLAS